MDAHAFASSGWFLRSMPSTAGVGTVSPMRSRLCSTAVVASNFVFGCSPFADLAASVDDPSTVRFDTFGAPLDLRGTALLVCPKGARDGDVHLLWSSGATDVEGDASPEG